MQRHLKHKFRQDDSHDLVNINSGYICSPTYDMVQKRAKCFFLLI